MLFFSRAAAVLLVSGLGFGGATAHAHSVIGELNKWKLTLPIDRSGGNTGSAIEIRPLSESYTHPSYYYMSNGSLIFSAPTTGATTGGSKYPRSELREMVDSANGVKAAWKVSQRRKLSAVLSVKEVPTVTKGENPARVIVGQIHGADKELCRLYYKGGKLYFANEVSSLGGEKNFFLKSASGAETSIPLNEKFSYTIATENGRIVVTAQHNGVTYTASDLIVSYWTSDSMYFKAGAYLGVGSAAKGSGTVGTGKAVVAFDRIVLDGGDVVPPPPPPPPPPPSPDQDKVVTVQAVKASTSDANLPANSIDGKLDTRWSGEGNGAWIQYDMGQSYSLSHIDVAWYKGSERTQTFEVRISNDPNFATYKSLVAKRTTMQKAGFEVYPMATVPPLGRYVRIVGYGNTKNMWNSILETRIFYNSVVTP
jgi:hypothetical protein